MRKQLLVLTTALAVIGLFTVVACKKSTTTPNNNNNNNNNNSGACSGGNLCFKLDGTQETYTAEWRKITGSAPRYRVYWESADQKQNIEIDMYGTAVGVYNVKETGHVAGDAGFQRWENGGKDIRGVSGTIEITEVDNSNNTISGKFTVSSIDRNNSNAPHEITEGNFEKVPLKP
ncbi:MAG: hypothetical protein K8F30_08845 [Taibaiella sp.]|nr:hypothetical protein [Taibaiella sp.]